MRPEYAGNYSAPDGQKLTFRAEQNHLIIMYNGQPIALEKRGRDRFLCPHPDFSLFLLHFTRDKGGVPRHRTARNGTQTTATRAHVSSSIRPRGTPTPDITGRRHGTISISGSCCGKESSG